jgi:hypothetical protein
MEWFSSAFEVPVYRSLFTGCRKVFRVCGEGVLVNIPWKVMGWYTILFVSTHANKTQWNWT